MGEVFWRMSPLEPTACLSDSRNPKLQYPMTKKSVWILATRAGCARALGPLAFEAWMHLFKVLRTQAQTPPDLSLPTHQAHHGFEACQRLPENADGKLDSEWITDRSLTYLVGSQYLAMQKRHVPRCCRPAGSWSNSFNENGSVLKWGILKYPQLAMMIKPLDSGVSLFCPYFQINPNKSPKGTQLYCPFSSFAMRCSPTPRPMWVESTVLRDVLKCNKNRKNQLHCINMYTIYIMDVPWHVIDVSIRVYSRPWRCYHQEHLHKQCGVLYSNLNKRKIIMTLK